MFFNDFFIKRSESKWHCAEGICGTSQVRGELGGIHLRFSPLVWDHTRISMDISMDLSMDISMDISMGISKEIH